MSASLGTIKLHRCPAAKNGYYLCRGYNDDAMYFVENYSKYGLRNSSPTWYKAIRDAWKAAHDAGYEVELGDIA